MLGVDELVAARWLPVPARRSDASSSSRCSPRCQARPRAEPATDLVAFRRDWPECAERCRIASLTVGWLVDGRSNPRRMTALVDALDASDRRPPSERFPWSPIDDS